MMATPSTSSNKENIKGKDGSLSSELLKEAIDEAEAYYEKYQRGLAELDNCKAAHAKLRKENRSLALNVERSEKEKQDLKDDLEKMLEALAIANEEMASTKRALQKLERAHVTLKTAHEAELKRRDDFVQALNGAKKELETLRATLQFTKESYRKSSAEATQLQVLLEKEMDEKAALRNKMRNIDQLLVAHHNVSLPQTTSTQTVAGRSPSSTAWHPNTKSSVPTAVSPATSQLAVEDVTDEEDVRVELQLPGSAVKLSLQRGDRKAHIREKTWVSKLDFKDT